MQRTLNLMVKHRESFRLFAPSVLRENVAEWLNLDHDSPYMLLTAAGRPSRRTAIPAVTLSPSRIDTPDATSVPRLLVNPATAAFSQQIAEDGDPQDETVHRQTSLSSCCSTRAIAKAPARPRLRAPTSIPERGRRH